MSERTQNYITQHTSVSDTPVLHGVLQRQCACGNHTMGATCESCGRKSISLQRKTPNPELRTPNSDAVPPIVHDVLRSPGQPLDAATRAFFEPRFSHDFSGVRVHTDAKAADSAQAMNALAYTVGRDVVFNAGQYSPGISKGRKLIAHELVHVAQQLGGIGEATAGHIPQYPPVLPRVSLANFSSLTMGTLGDQFEQEAEQMADAVVNTGYGSGRQFGFLNAQGGGHVIRRQKAAPSPTKEEQRDKQLRQLARFPLKALEQWKNLKVKERDTVLREMTKNYGENFTNDFTEYAFGIKRPDLSGAVLQSTPKELMTKGYRYAGSGNVWVHPSGHEIYLLSPKSAPVPPEDDRETRCANNCLEDTQDEDECKTCCEAKFPDRDSECRKYCDARCTNKL